MDVTSILWDVTQCSLVDRHAVSWDVVMCIRIHITVFVAMTPCRLVDKNQDCGILGCKLRVVLYVRTYITVCLDVCPYSSVYWYQD
jgi:hypothetical protein